MMPNISLTDGPGDQFVRFDEFEDAVLALELVAMLAKDVQQRPVFWKWIITGMQNAVQAAMVVALAGADGCGALSEKSRRENRQWLNYPSGDRPSIEMARYPALLNRIQDGQLMQGPPLAVSADDHRDLERLNELRREFAHFNPQGWVIELDYILKIMPVALTTVEFLLGTQDRPQMHLTDMQKSRIQDALANARNSLAAFDHGKRTAADER